MKKKKIISAVSAVALAVSSLVPLSANAYEIVKQEKAYPDYKGDNYHNCWIKQDENDHMGFSPVIQKISTISGEPAYGAGWLCNIKFTTADGSILTKADFPEYGGEESKYFDISYEDGVHTMSFRSSYCFLSSAQEDALKRARSLSLRKNIENVETTQGEFIQYCLDEFMLWENGLKFVINVPYDDDYVPTTEDFKGMDINKIEENGSFDSDIKYKMYMIYTNVTEEELEKDYLLSNAYVDNYLKLEEIQEQSGKFKINTSLNVNFMMSGSGFSTVPEDDAGDFNADGEIDVRDFFTLSQFIAEVDKEIINADQADVNRDGVADVSDLLAIAQYIVK